MTHAARRPAGAHGRHSHQAQPQPPAARARRADPALPRPLRPRPAGGRAAVGDRGGLDVHGACLARLPDAGVAGVALRTGDRRRHRPRHAARQPRAVGGPRRRTTTASATTSNAWCRDSTATTSASGRPGGFHLRNPAAEREWRTAAGRARFIAFAGDAADAPAGHPLRLTTVRSHDQYNTTVYGLDDRYRGVYGRRDVRVHERGRPRGTRAGGGRRRGCGGGGRRQDTERRLGPLTAVAYPIARGSCAAYYPEAMPLIALEDHDPESFTPAYKSTWVRVEKAPVGGA